VYDFGVCFDNCVLRNARLPRAVLSFARWARWREPLHVSSLQNGIAIMINTERSFSNAMISYELAIVTCAINSYD